jgi:uncharacterized membrane protein YciS (DUF1049 family)
MAEILTILATLIAAGLMTAVTLFNGWKQRKQIQDHKEEDRIEKEKEKKENESPFGKTVAAGLN